jgi:hypothetical protein
MYSGRGSSLSIASVMAAVPVDDFALVTDSSLLNVKLNSSFFGAALTPATLIEVRRRVLEEAEKADLLMHLLAI